MKNIRHDDDSLRGEYSRSDFGEMVRGKYAMTQLQFGDLVSLLFACLTADTGLKFIHHSPGNYLADHKPGDWTYEFDNANQITLRYWLSEHRSIEEQISNPPCITTPQERAELQKLLTDHVHALRTRVDAL